jgi:hypothetical protein
MSGRGKVSPVFDRVAFDVLAAMEKHSGRSADLKTKAAMAALGVAIDLFLEGSREMGIPEDLAWTALSAAILAKAKADDGALIKRLRGARGA